MATAVASRRLLDRTNATTTAARLAVAPSSTQTSAERERFSSSANCSVPAASRAQHMRQTQARSTAEATVQATSAATSGAVNAATAPPATSPVVRLVSTRRTESTRPAFSPVVIVVCTTSPACRLSPYPGSSQSCGVDVSGHPWALLIGRGADKMGPVMCGREQVSSQGSTVVALLDGTELGAVAVPVRPCRAELCSCNENSNPHAGI